MSNYTIPLSRSLYEPPPRMNARHPLTPPETDFDYGHSQPLASAPAGLGIDLEPTMSHFGHPVTETPTLQPRKVSSLAYFHSGMRESRDRVIQRSIKWLVMVIPPASFVHEHGHLGSTLSSGPSNRLSHGILMPLYPTMGGQLGAIAREFSLPSIAGLCLYLNTTSAGVAVTPRITDETWTLLWAQFLDTRNSNTPPSQLPICGHVEFDIDLRKARWYDAWLAAPRRDVQDVPVSVTPSRPQSTSHWRGDSRTTFLEDQGDDLETISLLQQTKGRFASRHVPRKLSLVDRFELSSVKSGSKLVPRIQSTSSPTEESQRQHSLSPIVQEDEPRSARRHLDQLITNWRESASQSASPLAATGQTSLDPANMPNTFPLNDLSLDSDAQDQLNLEDFAWSISSAGPPEYDDESESHSEWDYDPSVHLADRLQGSVCLTPTTCTSFGPPEYDSFSPISYVSRLPSPDIARRMLDDCPPTPSTCTSWGAPSHPNSPYPHESRAPSVDLAHRGTFSRPATPSTATTWGAMDSYPTSPFMSAHVEEIRTPDAGERSFGDKVLPRQDRYEHWSLVWPYYSVRATELPERWMHIWPYTHGTAEVPSVSSRSSYGQYPHLNIYPAVYPFFDLYPSAEIATYDHRVVENLQLGAGYPSFNLYTSVYPHLDIYPAPAAVILELQTSTSGKVIEPKLRLQYVQEPISTGLTHVYPTFDIYRAVYPWNLVDIYLPVVNAPTQQASLLIDATSTYRYPFIQIYTPVYPYSLDNIYPAKQDISRTEESQAEGCSSPVPVEVKLTAHYPSFDIYPLVYPDSLSAIYPPKAADATRTVSSQNFSGIAVRLPELYPVFNLYPSLYPHNLMEIYPGILDEPVAQELRISSPLNHIDVKLSRMYPDLEIYSSVYPWSLQTIYTPSVAQRIAPSASITTRLDIHYPLLKIYPAVYPTNLQEIYPGAPSMIPLARATRNNLGTEILVSLPATYPAIDLYPFVYPHNLDTIYPMVKLSPSHKRSRVRRPSSSNNILAPQIRGSRSTIRHAAFVPPVPPLPQNLHQLKAISPLSGLPLAEEPTAKGLLLHESSRYPTICLYPAVYPYFSIYPALEEHDMPLVTRITQVSARLENKYPILNLYPAVYPNFDIYPSSGKDAMVAVTSSNVSRTTPSRIPRRPRKHTHADLYIQVFGRTPPSSPGPGTTRQLPTPPAGSPSHPPVSPWPIPIQRSLSRSRSGTVSTRPGLPTPPSDGSPVRHSRQLPAPPGGFTSPAALSPGAGRILSPRSYGLPSSPAATKIPSPRPSPLSSPLPPVSEFGVASMSPSRMTPPSRRIPAQLELQPSPPYYRSGSVSASLPGSTTPATNEETGLSRTMSVPPRPLPRARSGSISANGNAPAMTQGYMYTRAPLPPVPNGTPVHTTNHP